MKVGRVVRDDPNILAALTLVFALSSGMISRLRVYIGTSAYAYPACRRQRKVGLSFIARALRENSYCG